MIRFRTLEATVQLHMLNARLAACFECGSYVVLVDEPCCCSDWNELVGTDHLAIVAGQPEQGFDADNLSAFHVNDRLVVQHQAFSLQSPFKVLSV